MVDLNMPIESVFADRGLLDRIVRTVVMLDGSLSYTRALEAVQAAGESERTLKGLLARATGGSGDAEPALRLLVARDRAVAAAAKRATKGLPSVDPQGRVSIKPGKAARILGGDEVLHQRRLAKARAVDGSYSGPDGEKRFREMDREHAAVGRDLVKGLRRPVSVRKSEARVAGVARELDQMIAAADSQAGALRQLEREIASVEHASADPQGDQIRGLWKTRAAAGASDALSAPVRLLESPGKTGRRLLDQQAGKRAKKPGKRRVRLTAERGSTRAGSELRAQIDAYLKAEGLPSGDFLKVLEYWQETGSLPKRGVKKAKKAKAPPGVYAPSHTVHQRVEARLRELEKPDSEYVTTLETMIANGEL